MGCGNANYAGGRNLVGRRALFIQKRAPVMYVENDGGAVAARALESNSLGEVATPPELAKVRTTPPLSRLPPVY
jgi:hypothetical protein